MKKFALSLVTISALCCDTLYAGTMGPVDSNEWTGFYLGANAGYWWSSSHTVNTLGTATYVSPDFGGDSRVLVNALASNATNSFSLNSNGFIGGGQLGYNYQLRDKWVAGLEVDASGLTQSKKSAVVANSVPVSGDFGVGTYTSTVVVSKSIDYLATVRGRLGMLLKPELLVYGTGGFAFGQTSLYTSFDQSPFSPPLGTFWSAFSNKGSSSQVSVGWAAGGGAEWEFRPRWTAKIEYLYYDLGTISHTIGLKQGFSAPPPNPGAQTFASANMKVSTTFAESAVRVGLNYRFDFV